MIKGKTGYDSQAEFNADITQHNMLDDSIKHDLTDALLSTKITDTERKKAVDQNKGHAENDSLTEKKFKAAINNDGEVTDVTDHKEAMEHVSAAIRSLQNILRIVRKNSYALGVQDDLEDDIANEKNIQRKMEIQPALGNTAKDINERPVENRPHSGEYVASVKEQDETGNRLVKNIPLDIFMGPGGFNND